jgi:predicted nucleic acid-binding protein
MKCLDTYALMAMAQGDDAYARYTVEEFFIPDTTLAEFSRVLLRTVPQEAHDIWMSALEPYAHPVDRNLLLDAMAFRQEHRKNDFSFFDAVGFVAALRARCVFVTGDEEFKGLENVEFVKSTNK